MFRTPRPIRTPTLRSARAMMAGAVVLASAAACKNTATNPGDLLGIAGTYQLVQVNAAPLPYQDGSMYVVRGSVTIEGSPRYSLVETDSSAGTTSNFTSSGQWNVSSNALTLKDDNGNFYFGNLTGGRDTIRVQLGTHLGTYVKQ